MNVLDVVFQYFEHRIPPSSPNPEEDVYNMRYRNRYFSLFPEDLNKDYNPYDFIEEPVEPRSFRKILTGLIGWTVIIPFILFLLLYQKNIETLSSLVVDSHFRRWSSRQSSIQLMGNCTIGRSRQSMSISPLLMWRVG